MTGRLMALRRTPIGHAIESVVLLASIGYTVAAVFDKVDRYRRHVTHDDTPDRQTVAIPVGDEPAPWPGQVAQQIHDALEHAAATVSGRIETYEFAPTAERPPSELLEDPARTPQADDPVADLEAELEDEPADEHGAS